MAIKTGYFGLEVSDLDAWETFGQLFGFVCERDPTGLFFRMDEKARRFQCVQGPADDIAWVGWDVDSVDEYRERKAALRAGNVVVNEGDDQGAALRGVEEYFHFLDPNGVRFEIAHGLREGGIFDSPYILGGFETGGMGIGHVAIMTEDYAASERFLSTMLGAHLSDHVHQRMPDGSVLSVAFMHTGLRHHSVAYVQGPIGGASKLHHVEVTANRIADLGTSYERLQAAGVRMGITLGQHPNDMNMSFYAQSPSRFLFELGYTGIRIEDEGAWSPQIYDRVSLWGHTFQAPLEGAAS